ncbi:HalOD1 output domain-containing protein [Halorussus sp. AFM4]|uniref:HalOD1 output domain-containing protein n=1 Tax=Halorussus sp. AFM4 TaxID=3421651 RepID=UPI003EBA6453
MSEFDARTLTERIVSKVSHRKDVDPVELQPPLDEVVDLDALDALFASRNGGTPRDADGLVAFTYEGYRIRVESGERIDIDEVDGGE